MRTCRMIMDGKVPSITAVSIRLADHAFIAFFNLRLIMRSNVRTPALAWAPGFYAIRLLRWLPGFGSVRCGRRLFDFR